MRRAAALLLLTLGCASASGGGRAAPAVGADPDDARLRRVVADYTALWRRETLDRWEQLFLPGFTVANTNADGTVNVRTREQFFEAQRGYHARVANLREDLEDVRIERHGRLASVWANYVVTEPTQQRRGRLVLLLIQDRGEYRIHSLVFSYHG